MAAMELKGSKSYKNYVLLASGFFMLVCVLSGLSLHTFIPTLIVMPLVVFIISLQKFTTRITVDDSFIEIEYWQLFQQKRRSIPLPGSSAAMRSRATKGGSYWELKITSDVEPNYAVDARNGFTKDGLQAMCDYINKATVSQALPR